ncbi:tetratricopeptide repeat protein [Commensalibacter nepenthis]|uniref:Tetratricopeptide repeat protein n=1 Tax=Commensalibacter nepenthis TaxID=3043872 RepID=A0ABT6Q571_9PROT|nr:tetratricopeptide repeat protein [Commensalibacter sp. TBRC 10068]MDI2112032.1 tetratricopeptide repeat protein [Commensalibacter sp. TBRC 10068]
MQKKRRLFYMIVTFSMGCTTSSFAYSNLLPSLINAQTQNTIDEKDLITHFIDKTYYPDDKSNGIGCLQAGKSYLTKPNGVGLYHLAQLHLIGCQMPADTRAAMIFYKQSVKQGNQDAVAMLKLIDQQGLESVQSLLMTLQHIQNQAHQDNAKAQYQLAMLYLYNHDLQTSLDWLEKSAQQGYLPALYQQGNFYFMGITGRADPVKAVRIWRKIAATDPADQDKAIKQAIIDADLMLGQIYYTGRDEIVKNPTQSFYYYEHAAKLGNKEGMHYIAMMYQQGTGVAKNLEQSQLWFNKLKE